MYDVFIDYNAGSPALSLTAWTNDTILAIARTTQDGVLVLTGSTGKRYVGSFRTTGVSGQTEDSLVKRYVSNYYNSVARPMRAVEATNTWTYTIDTYRQANGAAGNQLDFVIGVSEALVAASCTSTSENTSASIRRYTAIGLDSTSSPATGSTITRAQNAADEAASAVSGYVGFPGIGRHYLAWLERSTATGTSTWLGDAGGVLALNGILGWVKG